MTDPQGAEALIRRWREKSSALAYGMVDGISAYDACADDLEAALSGGARPQECINGPSTNDVARAGAAHDPSSRQIEEGAAIHQRDGSADRSQPAHHEPVFQGAGPERRDLPDLPRIRHDSTQGLTRQNERLRQLAKEAVNGWACHARARREHDEIARLHSEIDRASEAAGARPPEPAEPELECDQCGARPWTWGSEWTEWNETHGEGSHCPMDKIQGCDGTMRRESR
jgi:hypothetical protein